MTVRSFLAPTKMLIVCLATITLLLALAPMSALADQTTESNTSLTAAATNSVQSGKWGTCSWEIDAEGTLTIHPGTGANQATPQSPWAKYASNIKGVRCVEENGQKVKAGQSCMYLFSGLSKAKSIDLKGLDISNTTSLNSMFRGCSSLTSLNLSRRSAASAFARSSCLTACSTMPKQASIV